VPHETAPASVLVVDDDEIMRVSLVDRLRMEGFETLAAPDLASARKLLRKQDIDLVITDIRLPDGDGRALFEEVCRSAPGTPVILMTAYISVADAVALTKAGAVDYLTKPFDLDEFVAKARLAIDRLQDLRASSMTAPDGTEAPAGSVILGRSAALHRIEKIAARIRAGGAEAVRAMPYHPAHARRFAPEFRVALAEEADRATAETVALYQQEAIPRLSVRHRLGQLQCPCLLINGAMERRFQPSRNWLALAHPQITIADLLGGHSINVECSQAFNAVLAGFILESGI